MNRVRLRLWLLKDSARFLARRDLEAVEKQVITGRVLADELLKSAMVLIENIYLPNFEARPLDSFSERRPHFCRIIHEYQEHPMAGS